VKVECEASGGGVLVDYCRRGENWFFFSPSKFMKYIGYLLTYF
jgi:hypothetical protein